MSNQIVISSGAKVRSLEGVLTGTAGIVNSVPLGGANGVATLDALGKVPLSQLPASVVTYLGTWNAATNTPTLTNGVGDTGDLYICNVAGTVNFGAGPITFAAGDWVIYNGSQWQKSAGASGTVTSVAVTESGDALTITGSPITTSGTINIGFSGTSGQYINGAGNLTTFPSLTGFVPYTGATGAVNLGAYDLTVNGLTIGKGNSSLSNNTALGYQTLFHITTGNYNTAVGYQAAHNTTTGAYNLAVGQSAMFTNTTGGQNTAIGLNALLNNTTGSSNVVVGLDGLQHNTTGSSNTAIGYNAGSHITGGSTPNTTASSSVYIGRDSKAKVDGGVNEIVIGYNAVGNGSNTTTFGNTSTTANYFTGSVNGGSFVKSGGTSSEFLKADGSVDSNTYVTTNTTQTITGQKTFNATLFGSDAEFSGSILSPIVAILDNTTYTKVVRLQTTAATNRDVYFPDLNGTVALLEGTQTFSGNKTFSALTAFTFLNGTRMDYGLYLSKGSVPSAFSGSTVNLYSDSGNNNLVVRDNSNTSLLQFQASGSYTYTYPASSGTLALTSNLSSYVPYTGATSAVDLGNNSFTTNNFIYGKAIQLDAGVEEVGGTVIFRQRTGISGGGANFTTIGAIDNNKLSFGFWQDAPGGVNRYKFFQFRTDNITISTSRVYQMPDADGTLALTSNLSSYVPYTGATSSLDLGLNSASASVWVANGAGSSAGQVLLKWGSGFVANANFSGIGGIAYGFLFNTNISSTIRSFIFDLSSISASTQRTYTMPNATGTIALTSDIPSLSGYVQGSGTTNTLSKWTASGVLGNSIISDNGSIATITGDLRLNNGAADGGQLVLASSGFSDWNLDNFSGNLRAYYGSTERFRLTNAGAATFSSSVTSGALFTNAANGTGGQEALRINNDNGYIGFFNTANSTRSGYLQGNTTDVTLATSPSTPLIFATANTEKMRITSTGNVGIGTSSPNISGQGAGVSVLTIKGSSSWGGVEVSNNANTADGLLLGFYGFTNSSLSSSFVMPAYIGSWLSGGGSTSGGDMRFFTSQAGVGLGERMRITSGGIVQLSKGQLEFTGDNGAVELGTTVGLIKYSSSNVILYYGTGDYIIKNNSGASGDIMFVKQDGTIRFAKYTSNGTLTTTSSNGTIAVSSDKNMKIDAGFVENGLDKVLSLKPRYFYWKDEEKFGNKKQLGFYAQEVNEVSEEASNTPEEGQGWGIYDRALIAILVKAIQELSAKVTALENK